MALDKSALKDALKDAFESVQTVSDKDTAMETLTDALANAFNDFVQSGDVTAKIGEIQVSGSATNQSNVAEIKLTGGIS